MKLVIQLFLSLVISLFAFAQEDGGQSKNRKFLNLTIGIETDESLSGFPPGISFKGDFRKNVRAKYDASAKTLRLEPQREGISTLTIHDSSERVLFEYIITVKKSRLEAVAKEIQSMLSDIEGIQIKIVNNKVLIDGQVLLPRDMNRIFNVVAQFGDQASTVVTLSPVALKKIAEMIARDINNPEVEVRAVNGKIVLQGEVNSDQEQKRAEVIAKLYMPSVVLDQPEREGLVKVPKPVNEGVINLITVRPPAAAPPGKIIQLVVHYVELQKDYNKGFRFSFMPSLADGGNVTFSTGSREPGGVVSQITGTINNLLPKLNWAKSHGYARVLESTTLMVQDGKKGMINSMQDLPYQTAAGANGVPVTSFKKVGMATAITPALLGERSDSINLEMDFNLSALVGTTDAGPITSENIINTSIVVRSGQSAAVGGLITNRSVTGYNKLPKDVSSNPILSLYASKDFSRGQSQFVVFVTPIIKSSASAGSEKIKKKFRLRD